MTTTTTATATEIADTLHTVLFGGRPEFAVTAWDHEGVGYVAIQGTGEVAGPGACFLYESADVAAWLASANDISDYDDFCASVGPVEHAGVARALLHELGLRAHAGGTCDPVIPEAAVYDADGDPIEPGDYIQTVGLSPEDSDFGEVIDLHFDGSLEVAWAGSASRGVIPPGNHSDLRIISRRAYVALREEGRC